MLNSCPSALGKVGPTDLSQYLFVVNSPNPQAIANLLSVFINLPFLDIYNNGII
jgi:hypothetical protein